MRKTLQKKSLSYFSCKTGQTPYKNPTLDVINVHVCVWYFLQWCNSWLPDSWSVFTALCWQSMLFHFKIFPAEEKLRTFAGIYIKQIIARCKRGIKIIHYICLFLLSWPLIRRSGVTTGWMCVGLNGVSVSLSAAVNHTHAHTLPQSLIKPGFTEQTKHNHQI